MKWWWPSSSSPWHFISVTGIKPIKVSFSLSKAALMPPDRLPHHQSTLLDQMHQYLSDTMIYIWMGTGTVNKITMMRSMNTCQYLDSAFSTLYTIEKWIKLKVLKTNTGNIQYIRIFASAEAKSQWPFVYVKLLILKSFIHPFLLHIILLYVSLTTFS